MDNSSHVSVWVVVEARLLAVAVFPRRSCSESSSQFTQGQLRRHTTFVACIRLRCPSRRRRRPSLLNRVSEGPNVTTVTVATLPSSSSSGDVETQDRLTVFLCFVTVLTDLFLSSPFFFLLLFEGFVYVVLH